MAFLDDYQDVAGAMAPLERIPDLDWISVTDHLEGAALAAAVAGRDVLVAMRERTRFDAEVFATLPDLRLLITAGTRNGAIDLDAATAAGITVCATDGRIVDTAALLAALEEGRIGGAGLDVYDTEPLPADHPLRRSPRTVLTPHVGYVTAQGLAGWYADVVDDVVAWQTGAPIRVLNA